MATCCWRPRLLLSSSLLFKSSIPTLVTIPPPFRHYYIRPLRLFTNNNNNNNNNTMVEESETLPPPKVVLAPMVRTGTLPTRLLALDYGADLVWGPETIDRAIIGCERTINPRTNTVDFVKSDRIIFYMHPKEKDKLIYQMGTASPELAVQAAKIIANDVSGIDLNAGCPKHFSVHAGMGAGLLKNHSNLVAILKALIQNVGLESPFKLPISVKIRLLDTVEQTHELITRLCQTGISKLTLHCRTTPMRPRERAIRDALKGAAEICRLHNVPFFVNGDVESRKHAIDLCKEYGITGGAMIAVAAERNPSVFLSEAQGGLLPRLDVAKQYFKIAMDMENNQGNTKFCLLNILTSKDPERALISSAKTYKDMSEILDIKFTMPEDLDVGNFKLRRAIEQEEKKKLKEEEKKKKERQTMYDIMDTGSNKSKVSKQVAAIKKGSKDDPFKTVRKYAEHLEGMVTEQSGVQ